jgi:hypothetical protein
MFPMRRLKIDRSGFQYGRTDRSSVKRFEGPTTSTPQRNTSG